MAEVTTVLMAGEMAATAETETAAANPAAATCRRRRLARAAQ